MSRALVTGASSGIGAAIAERLAADGYEVTAVARDPERLASELGRLEKIRPAGHRAVAADVTTEEGIGEIAAEVEGIDALIHSAGAFGPRPFAEIDAAELDRIWGLNVRAPFLLTRALLGRLSPRAAVIFVSSTSGQVGMARQAAYGTTKAAVDGLTRTLAVELAPRGVRVNAVAPGFIETPMNAHLRADPTELARRKAAILAGRLGRPDEVAAAVSYLVSEAADFVYGVTLRVDGGYPTAAVQRDPTWEPPGDDQEVAERNPDTERT